VCLEHVILEHMTKRKLKLGTRGSKLALVQSEIVQKALERKGNVEIELRIITTAGDRESTLPLNKIEGKGFFTKEIEQALLNKEIDLAVHSLKDLMTALPEGLKLGAVGFRADRRELLVMQTGVYSSSGVIPITAGAVIGTGSARRQAQIAVHNPGVVVNDIRGNVPTRVEKVRNGEYDAIVVAAAGIERLDLDLSEFTTQYLAPDQFLPAPGQGMLAIQIRSEDSETDALVRMLEDPTARTEAALERGLLEKFDSGCSLPLGVYTELTNSAYRLVAVLGHRDGQTWLGLRRAEVLGEDIDTVVASAYDQLAVT